MRIADEIYEELPPEGGSRTKHQEPRASSVQEVSPFRTGNGLDTPTVCDLLGIENDGTKARCPGCGEYDAAITLEKPGLKCLHDRCQTRGKRGWRSNIDVVAEVRNCSPVEAVNWLAEKIGFEGVRAKQLSSVDNSKPEPAKPSRTAPASPADIIARWQTEGPLVRVPTGIRALDEACRGGLPIPWRTIAVGAPAAGKTFLSMIIARFMSAHLCVGVLGVDEEPDDLTVRLLQMHGFSVAQAEQRDPVQLQEIATALSGCHIRLYDASWTIESSAADVAAWAKSEGRSAVWVGDSIQAIRSDAGAMAKTSRELVEANVGAMRYVSTRYRLLTIATCEANRQSYREADAADTTNDLAAGAESRAIEFGAQTQLMLRTPKGEPDVIHVRIAKNRRAHVGEFWLRLDRDGHTITECGNPAEDPHVAAAAEEERGAKVRREVEGDAAALAGILGQHPGGLGEEELRAAIRHAGQKWGRDRLNAARGLLLNEGRLTDASGGAGRARQWRLS